MRSVIRVSIVVLALACLVLPTVALAHGGGTPMLTRAASGPYWLYVFTEPARPQAGSEYHVTVAVTAPQEHGGEQAVENAAITVRFVPANGEAYSVSAEPSIVGPGYYEADTRLPDGGAWTVQVEVNSPLGAGNAEYNIEAVAAQSSVRWGWIGAGVALVLAGVALFAFAFTKRGAAEAQTTAPL